MNSNMIRFSGMASGMDTESIVKQMMQAKKYKVDKYGQTKVKNEWRQEAYHNVNKDIANFIMDSRKKLGLTKYTYTGQLYPGSIDKVDWAKKANSSDENAFTAKATAAATDIEYDIQIKQLAKGANITGKAIVDITGETKLEADTTVKLNINGEEKTIDLKQGQTMAQAIKAIQKETGLNISFSKVGQKEGKDTSMLFMSSKGTGAGESIALQDQNTKDFFAKLGVDMSTLSGGVAKGQNSKIIVNGGEIENTGNQVDLNGIQLTLKKETAQGVTEKVSVTTDVDGIYDKIKGFVEDYNKLVGGLQDKVKEKEYRDYQPLTKEQKEAMKEDEVKLWEEKSKSGLLKDSREINKMLSRVRSGAYEKVEGAGTMYEIGITTGNYKDGAKLEINEDKLRKAIAADPQKVLDVLFKSPEDVTNNKINKNDSEAEKQKKLEALKNQRANTGVFTRIMQDMSQGMEEIINRAGTGKNDSMLKSVRGNILADFITQRAGKSDIDTDIFRLDKSIADENRRLSAYEESLWKKFAAMEKAMQQMQSQSGWMAQQFGGQ